MNRSRVGIALSGAAILLACGGVAAAAAGAPLGAGLVTADPTVSVTATATPAPSDTDDDGVEPGDDPDGTADDAGEDRATRTGRMPGTTPARPAPAASAPMRPARRTTGCAPPGRTCRAPPARPPTPPRSATCRRSAVTT